MYVSDNKGEVPRVVSNHRYPAFTNEVYADNWMRNGDITETGWDGLGSLYIKKYVAPHMTYFCPSRSREALLDLCWPDGKPTLTYPAVVGEYQIRNPRGFDTTAHYDGTGNGKISKVSKLVAVFDCLEGTIYSHKDGLNVGYYDSSVVWFRDNTREFYPDVYVSGGSLFYYRPQSLYALMDRR